MKNNIGHVTLTWGDRVDIFTFAHQFAVGIDPI